MSTQKEVNNCLWTESIRHLARMLYWRKETGAGNVRWKYYMAIIRRWLRKILSKRFETVSVDEFRPSKMCCSCEKELECMKLKGNTKKVYRCLICKECNRSESKQSVFLTRDFNSANFFPLFDSTLTALKIYSRKFF